MKGNRELTQSLQALVALPTSEYEHVLLHVQFCVWQYYESCSTYICLHLTIASV